MPSRRPSWCWAEDVLRPSSLSSSAGSVPLVPFRQAAIPARNISASACRCTSAWCKGVRHHDPGTARRPRTLSLVHQDLQPLLLRVRLGGVSLERSACNHIFGRMEWTPENSDASAGISVKRRSSLPSAWAWSAVRAFTNGRPGSGARVGRRGS
jgi:hypothetical protein